jgi:hypothetical protein
MMSRLDPSSDRGWTIIWISAWVVVAVICVLVLPGDFKRLAIAIAGFIATLLGLAIRRRPDTAPPVWVALVLAVIIFGVIGVISYLI